MATIAESILNELREEVPATRRVLERLPEDKLTWKPHAKSRTLGELAMHVAAIPGMAERIANSEQFSPGGAPSAAIGTVGDIRSAFEKNVRLAEETLEKMSDEAADSIWLFSFKGKEIFRRTRAAALRKLMLNHIYHHRGQLTVYLRLLDVGVPAVLGPTADENPFA